jgi:hypothetical protein
VDEEKEEGEGEGEEAACKFRWQRP